MVGGQHRAASQMAERKNEERKTEMIRRRFWWRRATAEPRYIEGKWTWGWQASDPSRPCHCSSICVGHPPSDPRKKKKPPGGSSQTGSSQEFLQSFQLQVASIARSVSPGPVLSPLCRLSDLQLEPGGRGRVWWEIRVLNRCPGKFVSRSWDLYRIQRELGEKSRKF